MCGARQVASCIVCRTRRGKRVGGRRIQPMSEAMSKMTARLSAEHRRVLVLDWPGHGRSEKPSADFGYDEMVEGALTVIRASGAQRVVPVAQAHAGWVAIELRRRLGERTPSLVLTSFLVLEPPPPFLAAMDALQDPGRWQEARERVFATWLEGVSNSDVIRFVREVMSSYGFEMWARAGREITAAYARYGTPLKALAALDPPVPTLHLYGQPPEQGYLPAHGVCGHTRPHRQSGLERTYSMLQRD